VRGRSPPLHPSRNRAMRFELISGQEQPHALLKREFARGRVSHAYLFLGPNQVGKTATAVALAQLLNCEKIEADSVEPCDTCDACIRIRENRHLDVQFVRPRMYAERKSGGSTERGWGGADLPPLAPEYIDDSIISIETVRHFLSMASHKPVAGRHRVYVFCEAEKMNIQAQNCLLKTLEEPIPNSSIILIAQHAGELLPTIVSRCQSVRFGLVAEEVIRDLLLQRTPLDGERAALIASMSGGRPGWAFRAAENTEIVALREGVFDFVVAVYNGNHAEALGLAERACEFAETLWRAEKIRSEREEEDLNDASSRSRIQRSSQAAFLEILAEWYRDILLGRDGSSEVAVTNVQALEWIQEAAGKYSPSELIHYIEQIHRARHYILSNANGHLVFEALFLNLTRKSKTRR